MRGKRVGSAQSARGIQLGGLGSAARCVGIPSRDPSPVPGCAPAGRISSAAVRRDRLWVGLERLGAKVARGSGRELYSAPSPGPRRFPGPWTEVLAAPSLPLPRGEGRGPSPPARLSTGADCPQCAPTASRRPGRGPCPRTTGARGRRRCRQPTRPVLKHGPRSLTHARVRGWHSKPRGAMKVRAGARRLRWDPGPAGPGAPPARLARTVGEVERERVR